MITRYVYCRSTQANSSKPEEGVGEDGEVEKQREKGGASFLEEDGEGWYVLVICQSDSSSAMKLSEEIREL
jgi:hypothetical protein